MDVSTIITTVSLWMVPTIIMTVSLWMVPMIMREDTIITKVQSSLSEDGTYWHFQKGGLLGIKGHLQITYITV